jgi:hypothetical protein
MTTNQQVGTASGGSGVDTARDEAKHLKDNAAGAARDVAETAKSGAADVTADVREQAQQLLGQTRDELGRQAGQQRDSAVNGLRSMGDELRGMAEHGSGLAGQLARHGADWTDRAVGFLDGREFTDILEDVRGMARRRPGRFLLGAVVAGMAAGRMTRAMSAASSSSSGSPSEFSSSNGTTSAPMTPTAGPGYSDAMPTGVTPGTAATGGAAMGDPLATGGTSAPPPPAGPPPGSMPPQPTPSAPDLDPGAPVQPRFGPGSGQ